jgi:hypothetical protein
LIVAVALCMERIYIGYCLLCNPFHLFMNKICLKWKWKKKNENEDEITPILSKIVKSISCLLILAFKKYKSFYFNFPYLQLFTNKNSYKVISWQLRCITVAYNFPRYYSCENNLYYACCFSSNITCFTFIMMLYFSKLCNAILTYFSFSSILLLFGNIYEYIAHVIVTSNQVKK